MQNTRDRILIKKIQITNCGGFIGEHSLNLSESSDKNFTIILGQSGRGKSTLFGLTYWCLYGKHYDKKNIDTATDEGIINSLQMKNLSEGEKITASIVLTINDQDGEKYKLERSITATQHKESSQKKFDEINNSNINFGIQTEEFSKMVMPDKYGELKTEKNESVINEAIRQILPQNLSSFFLFDGEKLVKFRTKDESSELIKDGIEKISGLQVVDTLITHSENTHKGISKQIAGKSVSSQGLSNSLEALELKISENKSEQATLESNLRTESSSHDEISNRISKSSEGDRIQKLLDKEQKNKKKILKDIKDHDKKIHDFLFDALPEILISDTLLDSEKSFQILEAQNKIPPSITREAIDKIFQSSPLTCVCDREFEEHDAAWVALENIKKTIIDKDLTTGITQGRALISQIRDRSSPDLLKKKHSELIITSDTLSRAKTESVSELSDLELELSEIPSKGTENFDQLAQMKKESFRKTVELKGQLNRLVEELGDLELEQKELEKNLTIRLATEDKFKSEIAKINILKSIVKYVKGRRKLIVDSLRSKTESATSKYFLESVPQGGEFDHVTISSNYNISARDEDDDEKTLSKGQSHVLGLSYVSGCRQITSTDTFLFIDSPLHNISGDARNDVAQILSKYLPNVQIVLFVTDTEYISGDEYGAKPVRHYINPTNKVWKEHEICVTCLKCNGKILKRVEDSTDSKCENCGTIYAKDDKTGPRIIQEYLRNV